MLNSEKKKVTWNEFLVMKEQLNHSGQLLIRIASGSMEPLLSIDSEYLLLPIFNVSLLRRFDLIVIFRKDRLVCHYLFRPPTPRSESFITRSLFGAFNDPMVSSDEILGILQIRMPWYWRCFVVCRLFVIQIIN